MAKVMVVVKHELQMENHIYQSISTNICANIMAALNLEPTVTVNLRLELNFLI